MNKPGVLLLWFLRQLRLGFPAEVLSARIACSPDELDAAFLPVIAAQAGLNQEDARAQMSDLSLPETQRLESIDPADMAYQTLQDVITEHRSIFGTETPEITDPSVLSFELMLTNREDFLACLLTREVETCQILAIRDEDHNRQTCSYCGEHLTANSALLTAS